MNVKIVAFNTDIQSLFLESIFGKCLKLLRNIINQNTSPNPASIGIEMLNIFIGIILYTHP